MSIEYEVGIAIPFTSDGKQVLSGLLSAIKPVRTEIAALQKQVADLDASLLGISGTAKAAAADITGVGAAMRASGIASDAASTAANNTARAYDNVARSASAAAMRVAQLNAAVTGGFADARAASASSAFVPPAVRQNGALALTGMRSVGAQNAAGEALALREEGWASAYFAGRGGGFNGGGNDNITGGYAYGRGRGPGGPYYGGDDFGGDGGGRPPRGPGGPGGGASEGPFGGLGGYAGGAIVHKALGAAKYAALGAAGYATDAVYEAAKFQSVLTSIQNVTGANDSQMADVRQRMFDIGHLTAESPVETARMFREIARQSQGQMSLKDQLGLLVPAAKLATVMSVTRGMSPEKTVDTVMSMAHLFRQYDPKGVPKMMDTILRMGELAPDTPATLARQMAIMEPTLKSLHVKDEDAAAIMVALSRFGMAKGRGGSSVQDLFQNALGPLQLTKHAQAGKLGLLEQLGVVDSKGNSKFFTDKGGDVFGFLEQLHQFSNKHGSVEALKVFKGAFGIQGTRFAAAMNDPVIINALLEIRKAIENQSSLGLDKQFKSIRGTADRAFTGAWNDFQGLATEIGTYTLPGLTKGFNDFGNAMHEGQHWLHQHKDIQVSIQRDVTNAIAGTEHYIATHKQDFIALGNDIHGVGKAAKDAGPDIQHLGDAFFGLMGTARSLGDALNQANKASQHSGKKAHEVGQKAVEALTGINPKDQDTFMSGSLTKLFSDVMSYNLEQTGPVGPVNKKNFEEWMKGRRVGAPSFQYPGLPQLPAPQVGPTRQAAQVFHIAPNVKVDIHGMNEQQAKDAVRKGVREGVADAMKTARQQSAMVALSKSGATVTGPTIPASLSIFGK